MAPSVKAGTSPPIEPQRTHIAVPAITPIARSICRFGARKRSAAEDPQQFLSSA